MGQALAAAAVRDPEQWARLQLQRALQDAPFERAVVATSTTAGAGGVEVVVVRLDCDHRLVIGSDDEAHRWLIRRHEDPSVGDALICPRCRRAGRRPAPFRTPRETP